MLRELRVYQKGNSFVMGYEDGEGNVQEFFGCGGGHINEFVCVGIVRSKHGNLVKVKGYELKPKKKRKNDPPKQKRNI